MESCVLTYQRAGGRSEIKDAHDRYANTATDNRNSAPSRVPIPYPNDPDVEDAERGEDDDDQ